MKTLVSGEGFFISRSCHKTLLSLSYRYVLLKPLTF
jgi:hypothetical protein